MEQLLTMGDGEKLWFHNFKFPIHGPTGKTAVGGIAMDITDRKSGVCQGSCRVSKIHG
jgi:hypothetical protein